MFVLSDLVDTSPGTHASQRTRLESHGRSTGFDGHGHED